MIEQLLASEHSEVVLVVLNESDGSEASVPGRTGELTVRDALVRRPRWTWPDLFVDRAI